MFPLPTALGLVRPSGPAASSYIVSIQPFEITIGASATSNTQTITSVNTSRSAIFYSGYTTTQTGSVQRTLLPRVELTNGTTVTATRDTASTDTVTVRGTVVEFASTAISSVQQGTLTIAASTTSGTATITSVTTSRSVVLFLGNTASTTTTTWQATHPRLALTNATTVTATRESSNTSVLTVGYCVIEFASGIVNSVQPRSVVMATNATSVTDTITSVTTGRTLLLYQGTSNNSSVVENWHYNLQLTNATTVTLTRTGTSTISRTVNYTALEFASGVVNSLQRGTIAIASATSANATITSVNTAKAFVNMPWYSVNGASQDDRAATVKLTSSTNVQGQKNTAGTSTSTPSYEVVEFV